MFGFHIWTVLLCERRDVKTWYAIPILLPPVASYQRPQLGTSLTLGQLAWNLMPRQVLLDVPPRLIASRHFWVNSPSQKQTVVQTRWETEPKGRHRQEQEEKQSGDGRARQGGGCVERGDLTYGRTQSNRWGAMRTFGGYMRQLWTYLISSTGVLECH